MRVSSLCPRRVLCLCTNWPIRRLSSPQMMHKTPRWKPFHSPTDPLPEAFDWRSVGTESSPALLTYQRNQHLSVVFPFRFSAFLLLVLGPSMYSSLPTSHTDGCSFSSTQWTPCSLRAPDPSFVEAVGRSPRSLLCRIESRSLVGASGQILSCHLNTF